MVTKSETAKKPAPVAKKKSEVAAASNVAAVVVDRRRVMTGTVMSNKMKKTIVVRVDRRVMDPLYKKFLKRSRRFKAHDEKNDAKIGDLVVLVESRPLSRDKRWVLRSIIRRAGQALEANI